MDKLKNEFCNELIKAGFTPKDAVRALGALACTLQGYNVSTKEANLSVYNAEEVTNRLIELYVSCKRVESCSAGYCKNIALTLPKLFYFVGKGAKEVNSLDIRAFLDHIMRTKNISNNTVERYRQIIYCFFAWLVNEGYLEKNPSASIKSIRKEVKEAESLTLTEVEILRASLQTLQERVLIEFLLSTGCRVHELSQVKVSDINFNTRQVLLHCKGNKEHYGFLSERAVVTIEEYLRTRGFESEYLYPSYYSGHGPLGNAAIEKHVKKIEERVKDRIHQHLHPHLFRHTAATIWLERGMSMQDVQVALGHASINTTRKYIKMNNSNSQYAHTRFAV